MNEVDFVLVPELPAGTCLVHLKNDRIFRADDIATTLELADCLGDFIGEDVAEIGLSRDLYEDLIRVADRAGIPYEKRNWRN